MYQPTFSFFNESESGRTYLIHRVDGFLSTSLLTPNDDTSHMRITGLQVVPNQGNSKRLTPTQEVVRDGQAFVVVADQGFEVRRGNWVSVIDKIFQLFAQGPNHAIVDRDNAKDSIRDETASPNGQTLGVSKAG
jgi:hypothetical protein